MATLFPELANVIVVFAPLFSKGVWQAAQVLLTGALLAVGPRTVASILRVMGHAKEVQFQRFHRVLNRAKWSSLMASRQLLQMLIHTFAPEGPLVMAIDDTIERRRGAAIAAKGIYRDPVRSSHSHFVKASGLRWICLTLLAPIPFAKRCWALPFCTVLAPSERYYLERSRQPKKLTDRARQMLLMVKRWLPDRRMVLVADSSYAALELLNELGRQMCVITRLRLDAALFAPVTASIPGARGRPRKRGQRLPGLQAVLNDQATCWQRVTISNWYSQGERDIDIASATALWSNRGKPLVPLRWVLVRDPAGRFTPQALLCTDQTAQPQQILAWFIQRWQIEVTFEEAHAHLGMETQRQWSDLAIARTTPIVLALFSIVALVANGLTEQKAMSIRYAAWYRKDCATFSDTLAMVRRQLWASQRLFSSQENADMIKIPRALFDRLTDTLSYAT
jgi:hypothetical protein